jgi:phosphotransferase system enzyme I (PtsI)
LSFAYEKEFRTQLRAILIASADAKIDIVLPMVSDVSQLRAARAIIDSEKALLLKKNIKFGAPLLGAMIEVPSAILTIDNIAAESDFLCLGTNDLVQYILAVDRDNEAVADWFHTLHPAVIRAIKISIDTAAKAGKALIVCGEMAGSPFYTPILLGLGAVELSMNFHSIARVRHVISSIAYEEARELVKVIEKSTTAEENDQLLLEHIDQKWRHVFETDGYPFLVKNRQ